MRFTSLQNAPKQCYSSWALDSSSVWMAVRFLDFDHRNIQEIFEVCVFLSYFYMFCMVPLLEAHIWRHCQNFGRIVRTFLIQKEKKIVRTVFKLLPLLLEGASLSTLGVDNHLLGAVCRPSYFPEHTIHNVTYFTKKNFEPFRNWKLFEWNQCADWSTGSKGWATQ